MILYVQMEQSRSSTKHGVITQDRYLHMHGQVRSAKCLLAAVAHVEEAVLVLVRVIYTPHQASCG